MRKFEITPGYLAKRAAKLKDVKRLSAAEKKTSEASKEARTLLRQQNTNEQQEQDQAGPSYAPGEF